MSTARDGVVECKFCHNVYTIPKEEAKSDTREQLAIASHELDACSFDRAYTAFSKAAEIDPSEPEAYFGMALATFKVQYLKDAAKKHLQPICHDINVGKVRDDKNYKKALSLATAEQKRVYGERADEIDSVSKEFNRLKSAGVHYDCFICVKVTDRDERGNQINTQDSYEALKLYNHLKKRGYNPFYSEEEIRGKAGAEYEATILYALYTSECMLVVCSNEEYLQTPWVKNEYSRFMELINDERKDSDGITIVFKGRLIERLPGKRALIQGVNLGNADAYASIEDFVERHTPEAKKMREENAKRKAEEEKRILASIEEQKRIAEQQRRAQEELEAQLRQLRAGAPSKDDNAASGASVRSLLKRAEQELSFDNTDEAEEYYRKVLDIEPENAEAWWGMFLLDYDGESEDEIANGIDAKGLQSILSNKNYMCASDYASGELKKRLEKFDNTLKNPVYWWERFLADMGAGSDKDALREINGAKIKAMPKNENYALALKYADEPMNKRISEFKSGLVSSDVYFRLFLEDFGVRNENDLLARMTEKLKAQVEDNANYKKALKGQREASTEYARRISHFYDALNGAEMEWRFLLNEYSVSDEKRLLSQINADNVDAFLENPKYKRISARAVGELKEKIVGFESELKSFDFWWKKFLRSLNFASDEEDYFRRCYSSRHYDTVMSGKEIGIALKYADKSEHGRVEAFRKEYMRRKEFVDQSTVYWNRVLSSYGCTPSDLHKYDRRLDEDENYKKAVAFAEEAGDKRLISEYAEIEREQARAIEQRRKEADKRKKENKSKARRAALIAVSICVPVLVIATLILGYCGVQPFWTFWTVWAAQTVPGYGWTAFPFVLSFAVVITVLATLKIDKPEKFKTIMKLLSVCVCAVFIFTGAIFMTVSSVGKSKVYIGDNYILTFAEQDDGTYGLKTYLEATFKTTDVIIPDAHNGKNITTVDEEFDFNDIGGSYRPAANINSLEIGANVTSVPSEALYCFRNINTLTLRNPDLEYLNIRFGETFGSGWNSRFEGGLKKLTAVNITGGDTLGASLLQGCENLTSVTLPDGIKVIGDKAFYGCVALTNLTLPDSVTSIGNEAFGGCVGLTELVMPENIEHIGANAFLNVPVTSIVLGNKMTEISDNAFKDNIALSEIVIPEGVTRIGKNAFSGCASLAEIKLPSTVRVIDEYAFSGCTSLTEISVPGATTEIGEYAFRNCEGLTNIKIGDGLEKIATTAFSGCKNVLAAQIPAVASVAVSKDVLTAATITSGEVIPDAAFRYCESLTKVTLPSSVKTIGSEAFRGCKGLESIVLPEGVVEVGPSAFRECASLESIALPNTLTTLADHAVWGCASLKSVKIPDGVTAIGDYAFSTCGGLESVELGDGVKTVGTSAFHSCAKLTNLTIPKNVTVIGESAFYNCSSLETVTVEKGELSDIKANAFTGCKSIVDLTAPAWSVASFPYDSLETVTLNNGDTLKQNAFSSARKLETVNISDTVTTIEASAFNGCINLYAVNISNSVTSVGERAFYNCTSLLQITVPEKVSKIGDNAFYGCPVVIYCKASEEPSGWGGNWNAQSRPVIWNCENSDQDVNGNSYTVVDGILYSLKDKRAVASASGSSFASDFTFPVTIKYKDVNYSVTAVGASAFANSKIKGVTVHSGIADVGNQAFYNCTSLTRVQLSDAATEYGQNVFGGSNNIQSITAPAALFSQFSKSNLVEAVISSGESIANSTFSGCTKLTDVSVPITIEKIGDRAFYNCSSLEKIVLSDGITEMGAEVFARCAKLALITLPEGLTTIGNSMFDGCRALTEVDLPSSITAIGNSAFYNCSALVGVSIPSGVTAIGNSLFNGCSSLESVSLPSEVTSIGDSAFYGCSSLESVSLPSEVTSIGDSAFYGCSSLKEITLPSGVISIGSSAFCNCSSLDTVIIPDGVTVLNSNVFNGCSSLTGITLPSSIKNFYGYALYNCGMLKTIRFEGTKEQWNAISKYSNWNGGTGNYTIRCTDGNILK